MKNLGEIEADPLGPQLAKAISQLFEGYNDAPMSFAVGKPEDDMIDEYSARAIKATKKRIEALLEIFKKCLD